ncbi:hypothetical protein TorRG33x02_081690 [Trema orientale]|uniref:Uncharacterized protein n=1 Tax=Trema orientale TaxID=63057 RepID=A0A2P5FDP7_TREOI|nr:hypothetical protein TorRG33x02_081690 [Trema orientale]
MEDKWATQTTMSGPRRGAIASISRQKAPTWNPLGLFFPPKRPLTRPTPKERVTRVLQRDKCPPAVGVLMMTGFDCTDDVAAVIPLYCCFNLTAQQRRKRA